MSTTSFEPALRSHEYFARAMSVGTPVEHTGEMNQEKGDAGSSEESLIQAQGSDLNRVRCEDRATTARTTYLRMTVKTYLAHSRSIRHCMNHHGKS